MIVARILNDPEPLGKIAIVQNLGGIVGTIAIFALPIAATKFISEHKGDKKERDKYITNIVNLLFFLTILSTSLYALFSDFISNRLYDDPTISLLIKVNALSILIISIFDMLRAIIRGFQDIKLHSILGVLNSLVGLPIAYFLILKYQALGVFLSLAITGAVVTIMSLQVVWSKFKEEKVKIRPFRFERKYLFKVIKFSTPIFISGFVLLPAYWAMNTFLAISIGFAQLGLSKIGRNLYNLFLSIPQILAVPLLPMISEIQGKDKSKASRTVTKILRVIMILVLPVALGIGVSSKFLIWLLFGGAYLGAAQITYFFLLAAYVDSLSPITSTYFVATGKTWTILTLDVIWALLFVLFGFFFIGYFGLLGLGYTYLLSSIVIFALKLSFLKKWYDVSISNFSKVFILSIIFSAAGYLIIQTEMITSFLLGIGMCISLIGLEYIILNTEEKELIHNIFQKMRRRIKFV
jgi:O-antigen/teichoic acid export membrane protein